MTKTTNAELEKEEIEQARREERAATKNLLTIKQAYPRTPEIAQRSYEAEKQIREVEREYQFKYGSIQKKYEAAFRQQVDKFEAIYQSQVAAIKSGVEPVSLDSEIPRAVAVPKSGPSLESPKNGSSPGALYSVVGVARGDALNVRSRPGANHEIVARLPNGYSGLRIVGVPVMNGTTEWVQIAFGNRTGWVTKLYLQPE
jgi:hypothetical protein